MITLAFYLGTRRESPQHSRPLDWLICLFTRSRFSHVELVLDHLQDGTAVCWSASPRDKQVRCTLIDLRSGRWVLRQVPGDRVKAMNWFLAHAGEQYDYRGVLSHLLPVLRRLPAYRPPRWYCSKACAAAVGRVLAAGEPTPQDLFAITTSVKQ